MSTRLLALLLVPLAVGCTSGHSLYRGRSLGTGNYQAAADLSVHMSPRIRTPLTGWNPSATIIATDRPAWQATIQMGWRGWLDPYNGGQ